MTALRRTTTPNGMPLQNLELVSVCDQCGKHRAHGNHQRGSKQRQAANRHKWEARP
ncbi:MAG: hypothetical protein ACRERX_21155 [Pseudomonas sp.]